MTIIDFEFTGLDNTFIQDNEIIQVKFLDTKSGITLVKNFASKKPSTAGAFLCHRLPKFDGDLFSREQFESALSEFNAKAGLSKNDFMGFGISQDKQMLSKYLIEIDILDLQEQLMLTDEYELLMATEGRSLEVCYYLVTGALPKLEDHSGISEIYLMDIIFHKTKDIKKNCILTVMPFGHCAGMPLIDYVDEYRRAADGYRFNNDDILALSLNYVINAIENYDLHDDGAYLDND